MNATTTTLIEQLQAILDSHHAKTEYVSVPIEQAIEVVKQHSVLLAALERLEPSVAAAAEGKPLSEWEGAYQQLRAALSLARGGKL